MEEGASEGISAAPALAAQLSSEKTKLRLSPVQRQCKAARAWRLTLTRRTGLICQSLLYWTQG